MFGFGKHVPHDNDNDNTNGNNDQDGNEASEEKDENYNAGAFPGHCWAKATTSWTTSTVWSGRSTGGRRSWTKSPAWRMTISFKAPRVERCKIAFTPVTGQSLILKDSLHDGVHLSLCTRKVKLVEFDVFRQFNAILAWEVWFRQILPLDLVIVSFFHV